MLPGEGTEETAEGTEDGTSEETEDTSEVEEALAFDMFGPPGKEEEETQSTPETPAEETPETPETPEQTATPETPVETPETPEAPAAAAESPELAALKIQLEARDAQINQLMTLAQQSTSSAQTPATPAAGEKPAKIFSFNVPVQFAEAIASDDPNMSVKAIGLLLEDSAEAVYKKVMEDARAESRQYVDTELSTRQQDNEAATGVFEDFYGAYPGFNNPALMRLVHSVATDEMNKLPEQQRMWTPQLRDTVAKGVEAIVGFSGLPEVETPTAPVNPETPKTPAARRKPPRQVKPGTRPANSGKGQGISAMEQEIADTLDF